ncbi:MAG: hypothetical protein ACPGPS_21335 [Rubripirellula sp.]
MSSTLVSHIRHYRIGLRQSDDNPLGKKMLFGSPLKNSKQVEVAGKNAEATGN